MIDSYSATHECFGKMPAGPNLDFFVLSDAIFYIATYGPRDERSLPFVAGMRMLKANPRIAEKKGILALCDATSAIALREHTDEVGKLGHFLAAITGNMIGHQNLSQEYVNVALEKARFHTQTGNPLLGRWAYACVAAIQDSSYAQKYRAEIQEASQALGF